MELCVHIRVLIIPIHTQRLYWLKVVEFTSGHSTLHLDSGYRTMFGDFGMGGAQQQSGIGSEEHRMVPIVEVAFPHNKWWSIPQEISAQL